MSVNTLDEQLTLDEQSAREQICRVGRSLFERGYVHSTAGNISVLLADGHIIMTPTDACLGFLQPETLALLDAHGQQLSGHKASKTLSLHRAIYEADPKARCVIHTHSTHLVQLTLQGVWSSESILPPITAYQVMKVGKVPLIAYHRPGDSAIADLLQSSIRTSMEATKPIRAAMIDRLGPNVWAANPSAAMALLEELEETAKLWVQSNPKPLPLTDTQIEELRQGFGAIW